MAHVILLKDVPKVGQKGDIKVVKDGFFRHFLLPNKLADLATAEKIRKHEEEGRIKKEVKNKKEQESVEELSKLNEVVLVFTSKATKKGSLYKGISQKDIEEKLRERGLKNISEDWIKLTAPLKEVGETIVDIEKPSGEKGRIKIEIKAS